ncbi:MAG: cadmium-translocating P-type ATPase [Oscillospiraceae bacterium]|nr:cadmium-translocating P-type ATPase [Oscillospiraceae bacterium]
MQEEHESVREIVLRIAITVMLLIISYCLTFTGIPKIIAFAVPYLVIGWEMLADTFKKVLHGKLEFDEELLMTAATLGAFAVGEYAEASAVLIFFEIGELFEHLATKKSRSSIAKLMDLRPDRAMVVREDEEIELSPECVKIGDVVRVRAGEKVPLDGVIVYGETTLQTAALTGESAPVTKKIGDEVLSGTINLSGVILVKVEREASESTAAKILELVENAASQKSSAENFITRFAKRYTPCVVICAILLAFLPPIILHGGWLEWIRRGCIFLMISCPCALVVSVPMSFCCGIGGASRHGILIKGANYLEKLTHLDATSFDKTGTLTRGEFAVAEVHPQGITSEKLLNLAAAAEQFSSHPIAESILKSSNLRDCAMTVNAVEEISGKGIRAEIDGKVYHVGNEKLMREIHVNAQKCEQVGTAVHLAENDRYLGYILIADMLKSDANTAISELHAQGIGKIVMLTGDNEKTAAEVAAAVGADAYQAEMLPAEKVAFVEKMMSDGLCTAFVGDGINDAPVLMRADLGIAMGALGSQAAMEAADIVLMDDKLEKIAKSIAISRKTMRIVRENIVLALVVKLLILVLGAVGAAGMTGAMIADVGVLILAVLNALRCMRV